MLNVLNKTINTDKSKLNPWPSAKYECKMSVHDFLDGITDSTDDVNVAEL